MVSNLLVRFSSRFTRARHDLWRTTARQLSHEGGVRNGDGTSPVIPTTGAEPGEKSNNDGKGDAADISGENDDDLFSAENTKDIPPGDLARLRLTFGLIREHIQAQEQGKDVDATSNPLLDPRSFEIKRLPKVPHEVLKHFRKEVPASELDEIRPVVTRSIWDSQSSEVMDKLVSESLSTNMVWDQVDARTMPVSKLNRRSRLMTGVNAQNSDGTNVGQNAHMAATRISTGVKSKQAKIVLRTNNGRIGVDVRALSTLNAFLSDTGKILPRRKSGVSARSQKRLAKAVKTARRMALLHPEPTGPTIDELLEMSIVDDERV